jgi:hypothetical protein
VKKTSHPTFSKAKAELSAEAKAQALAKAEAEKIAKAEIWARLGDEWCTKMLQLGESWMKVQSQHVPTFGQLIF